MAVLLLVDAAEDELSRQALTLARELGDRARRSRRVGGSSALPVARAHIAEGFRTPTRPARGRPRSRSSIDRTSPAAVVARARTAATRCWPTWRRGATSRSRPTAPRSSGDTVTRVRWGGSLLEEARVHRRCRCSRSRRTRSRRPRARARRRSRRSRRRSASRPRRPGGRARRRRRRRRLARRGQGRRQRRPRRGLGRGLRDPRGAGRAAGRRGGLLARGHERRLAPAHRPGRPDRHQGRRPTSTSPAASAAPPSTSRAARAPRRSSRSTPTPRRRSSPAPTTR